MKNIPETITGEKDCKQSAFLRFVRKSVLFAMPFWALIALYVYDDPFMVLRKYEVYDSDVMLNEQHVGWQIYRNHKDSMRFNSFILGNSCTVAFRCGEWEKYLDPGDRAIRLFGNAESMKAISLKLRALDREDAEIKNVLMVLDRNSLARFDLLTGASHILPAAVSGRNPFAVQMEFMQAFAMPDFLFPYLKYRITGHVDPDMKRMNPYGKIRDSKNNDGFNPREKMIGKEGESYWKNRKNEFPKRDAALTIAEPAIFHRQRMVLDEIMEVLRRHGTSIRVLISPDYNQKKLHPDDLKVLQSIFGKENVYDFSGINEFTKDYHNYYEAGHYRPLLGNKLLEIIYKRQIPDKHKKYEMGSDVLPVK